MKILPMKNVNINKKTVHANLKRTVKNSCIDASATMASMAAFVIAPKEAILAKATFMGVAVTGLQMFDNSVSEFQYLVKKIKPIIKRAIKIKNAK